MVLFDFYQVTQENNPAARPLGIGAPSAMDCARPAGGPMHRSRLPNSSAAARVFDQSPCRSPERGDGMLRHQRLGNTFATVEVTPGPQSLALGSFRPHRCAGPPNAGLRSNPITRYEAHLMPADYTATGTRLDISSAVLISRRHIRRLKSHASNCAVSISAVLHHLRHSLIRR